MNKRKLVNIILKDLEEVRLLSEEVAESQDESLIEIDLALNRAKLLVQEIELLRELAGAAAAVSQHSGQVIEEDKAEEVDEEADELVEKEINYPEPELEIVNFDDGEFSGIEELDEELEDFEEEAEEDEDESEDEIIVEEELTNELEEEEEELEIEEDDKDDDELEEDDKEEDELEDDELEEEDWDEEEEEEIEAEPEVQKEEPTIEEVKPKPTAKIHTTVLKSGPQEGFREINIDDMEDDMDIQPIRVSPPTGSTTRPPMREIPKPEDAMTDQEEKTLVGEKYQKERSVNETLGENKAADSKLMNGPISSLKAAIGLNDRFLFIREIFNNNSAKYNEVIENLDKMEQISEAVEYLRDNLTMQKNEASMKFVDLLKRRFTK